MSPNHDPAAQKNKNALNKLARKNMLRRTALRKELRASDNRYQHLIHAINGILWEADASTLRFSFVSQQAERILGYPLECWINEPTFWRDHIHPADQEWAVTYCLACTGEMIPHEFEYRMIAADGRTVWLHDRITVISQSDQPRTLYGVMVDITERKQAEEELRKSEEQIRLLFENSMDAVLLTSPDGKILSANPATALMFGRTKAELQQLGHEGIVDVTDPRLPIALAERVRTGKVSTELTFIRQNGEKFAGELSSVIFKDRDGQTHTSIVIRDITERKQAEESLRVSEEKWRNLFQILPVGVSIVDTKNGVVENNPALERILEMSAQDLLNGEYRNRKYLRADNTPMPPEEFPTLRALQEQRMIQDVEIGVVKEDGVVIWTCVSAAPFSSFQDTRTVTVTMDITERKQAEDALRESEQRLQLATRAGNIGVWDWDIANDKLVWDDNSYSLYSIRKEDFGNVYDAWLKTLHSDDRDYIDVEVQAALRGAPECAPEFRIIRRDGEIRVMKSASQTLYDENGKARRMIGVNIDITALKQAENELRESERRLNFALKVIHTGGWDLDLVDHSAYRTVEHDRIFGYESLLPEWTYEMFLEHVLPEDRTEVSRSFGQAIAEQGIWDFECRIRRADGEVRWIWATGEHQPDELGQMRRMSGVVQDITERKQAENQLRKVQAFISAILELAPASIYTLSLDQRFTLVNRQWEQDTQIKRADAIGRSLDEIFPSALAGKYREDNLLVANSSKLLAVEEWAETPNGLRCYYTLKFPLQDSDGFVESVVGLSLDITARKQMEEALANERNLLRTLIDNLPDAIYVKDSKGRFLLKNRADAHKMGAASPEETIGKTDFDYYPAALAAHYHADDQAVMHSGQAIINQEEPVIDAANRAGWVSTTKVPLRDQQGRVIGLVGIGHDITAQKQADEEKAKLEAQLYQAHKMESVGRLAGGVAHDFNNMLGVILGHTELALYQIDPDLPQRANLEEIQKAAQRSANLTSQLLAFARQQVIAPKVLDLNETVAATLTMLQRMIGENIQLIWSPAAALWAVNIDPTQIDQILANLCVNARDAISDVGKIMIETGNRVFDEAYCALHPDCMPGHSVMLSVRDTGNGMNEQTQAHLFEPFFTTKPLGHGTGLGLATVYGIVKQNNGFIRVSSKVGQGTTFHIYLPSHGVANVSEPEPRTAYRTPGGGETILLVEDEPSVLRLSRTMLTRLGYHVLSAETRGVAIELSGTHSGPIHLLMTDVIMPEMNGRDLGNYLVIRYPQIKRLFMSGYTAEIIAPQGVLEDGVFFIQKPFSMKDLAAKVREVIAYGKPNDG